MTYEQLMRERAAILWHAEDLQRQCESGNRSMTTAERSEMKNSLRRIDEIDEEIKRSGLKPSPGGSARPTAPASSNGGDGQFRNIGEFLGAVASASVPGGYRDERLQTRAASGMNETVGSEGGFLVESELASDLLEKVFTSGEILRRVRRVPLTAPNSNGIKIPFIDEISRVNGSRLGGVRAYWQAEAAATTATKPKIGQLEMGLNKLFALCV